jgi:hypothetical protein
MFRSSPGRVVDGNAFSASYWAAGAVTFGQVVQFSRSEGFLDRTEAFLRLEWPISVEPENLGFYLHP